jgi:hypothetical protein
MDFTKLMRFLLFNNNNNSLYVYLKLLIVFTKHVIYKFLLKSIDLQISASQIHQSFISNHKTNEDN